MTHMKPDIANTFDTYGLWFKYRNQARYSDPEDLGLSLTCLVTIQVIYPSQCSHFNTSKLGRTSVNALQSWTEEYYRNIKKLISFLKFTYK